MKYYLSGIFRFIIFTFVHFTRLNSFAFIESLSRDFTTRWYLKHTLGASYRKTFVNLVVIWGKKKNASFFIDWTREVSRIDAIWKIPSNFPFICLTRLKICYFPTPNCLHATSLSIYTWTIPLGLVVRETVVNSFAIWARFDRGKRHRIMINSI